MSNIDALKKIIVGSIETGEALGAALDDGAIQLRELPTIAVAIYQNFNHLRDFKAAWAELRDLDEKEASELSAHVAATLNLPDDVAEYKVELAFKALTANVAFLNEWNAAAKAA